MHTQDPPRPRGTPQRRELEPDRHSALHPELDAWRANVGSPVALDAAPIAPPHLECIDVLCWNVAIGLGRLEHLLERLRGGAFGGAGSDPARPLVILVQEAFRADDTVPGRHASQHHGGALAAQVRGDVVDVARRAGLSLRYSPSMRNGVHPSDRGNAVLATARLSEAHAVLLPYVRQRRVAVTACLAGHEDIRFVSAHLDTHGQPRLATGPRRFGAGRVAQAHALAEHLRDAGGSVVLGADLNSLLGVSDPAVRTLVAAGLHPARRIGTWRHTFHTSLKLLLDHVLYHSPDGRIAGVDVHRLDEVPGDRSRGVFGSDHHPLLARVRLQARPGA